MKLVSRIFLSLGSFLIVMGVVYWLLASRGYEGLPLREYEGLTEMLTVAGGALVVGGYLARVVQRAGAALTAEEAGAAPSAADTEPHVPPTIWPLVFALSMIGVVLGAVGPRWVLAVGAVLLVTALAGWSLDVRRQWRHHDHEAEAAAAPDGAHRRTGQ